MKTQSFREQTPEQRLLSNNHLTLADLEAAVHALPTPIADVYLQQRRVNFWHLDEARIQSIGTSFQQGIGLRASSSLLTSYASADAIHLKALQAAGKELKDTLTYHSKRPVSSLPPIVGPTLQPVFLGVELLEKERSNYYVEKLLQLDRYIRKQSDRVMNVQAVLGVSDECILILNELGQLGTDVRPMAYFQVNVVVSEQERTEVGAGHLGGRYQLEEWEALLEAHPDAFEAAAEAALRQALVNLKAQPAPAGRFPVILGNGWPGILLHEAVGHGLEADAIRKNLSVFSNKQGELVASPLCTVIDDGTIIGARGSLTIDDEGTPTQRTLLIEEGILKGYMQDRQTSAFMGVSPTGNGRRMNYSCPPIPRMTNTFLLPGKEDPAAILEELPEGIYAPHFQGGQVDTVSGRFSFVTAEAYWVEKGQIKYPIRDATLVGSGLEVMQSIERIGSDFVLNSSLGLCGKLGQSVPVGVGQPTVLVKAMTVGGSQ